MNKPNIQDVLNATTEFERAIIRAQLMGTLASEFIEAREKLIARFKEMGLYDYIDW